MTANFKYWSEELSFIAGVLGSYLQGISKEAFAKRNEVAHYVDRCAAAGFCKTEDDVRACAARYLAGKRKITSPGTARRLRESKERAKLLANVPKELTNAIAEVIEANSKAIEQYRAGNEKAVNALVGQVMRKHKTDAAVIKQLLIQFMS